MVAPSFVCSFLRACECMFSKFIYACVYTYIQNAELLRQNNVLDVIIADVGGVHVQIQNCAIYCQLVFIK